MNERGHNGKLRQPRKEDLAQKADVLFTNALVLTMDEELAQFEVGAVAVKGDSILAVGNQTDLRKQFEAAETVDCGGKVLMKDRQLLFLDEAEITARSRELAAKVWERYSQ